MKFDVQPSRHSSVSVACAHPLPRCGSFKMLLESRCPFYDTLRSVSTLFGTTCHGQTPKLAHMIATPFFFRVAYDLGVGVSHHLPYILQLGSGSNLVCVQVFTLLNNTFVSFHIYYKSSFGDLVLEIELLSVIFLKTQHCHFFLKITRVKAF